MSDLTDFIIERENSIEFKKSPFAKNEIELFIDSHCRDCLNQTNDKDLCKVCRNIKGELVCENEERINRD